MKSPTFHINHSVLWNVFNFQVTYSEITIPNGMQHQVHSNNEFLYIIGTVKRGISKLLELYCSIYVPKCSNQSKFIYVEEVRYYNTMWKTFMQKNNTVKTIPGYNEIKTTKCCTQYLFLGYSFKINIFCKIPE